MERLTFGETLSTRSSFRKCWLSALRGMLATRASDPGGPCRRKAKFLTRDQLTRLIAVDVDENRHNLFPNQCGGDRDLPRRFLQLVGEIELIQLEYVPFVIEIEHEHREGLETA